MPEISRFFGMVIIIYYNDHAPAHFHVKYNENHAKITIDDLKLIEGGLPKKALSLGAFEHRQELQENWILAMNKKKLNPIKPLE